MQCAENRGSDGIKGSSVMRVLLQVSWRSRSQHLQAEAQDDAYTLPCCVGDNSVAPQHTAGHSGFDRKLVPQRHVPL